MDVRRSPFSLGSLSTWWLAVFLLVIPPCGAAIPAAQRSLSPSFRNGGFEEGVPDSTPPGWFVPTEATRAYLTTDSPAEGRMCVAVIREGDAASGFGNLMQKIDAQAYRGKRVRFSAMARHMGVGGKTQLWLRVDLLDGGMGFFDNMGDRPIRSDEWKRYDMVADIDETARSINLGVMLMGAGTSWVDGMELTEIPRGPSADTPPRALSARGLENLIAFARLYGYVRHFHPADEARSADWSRLAIAGVEQVETAAGEEALAQSLSEFFAHVAPSVNVWAGGKEPQDPSPPAAATRWLSWEHAGYAQDAMVEGAFPSVYRAEVVEHDLAAAGSDSGGTRPGTALRTDLGGGVHALIPIGTYADEHGTLPRATGGIAKLNRPEGWEPSGDDRSTRLAAVIVAWNILEHFYPYFDVAGTDWPAVLRGSLERAAEDPDARAFQKTLELLGAGLKDGHTRVAGPGTRSPFAPLSWEWIGQDLVITQAPDSTAPGIRRGDVVLSIDGRSTADVYADVAATISAATEQWRRFRSLQQMASLAEGGSVALDLRHPDGSRESMSIPRIRDRRVVAAEPAKPDNGAEVAPGIRYFDLNGAEMERLSPLLDEMAHAKGVIFDLRGYPASAGVQLLQHLCDKPIRSAHWNVPINRMPDREGVTFENSDWELTPEQPHFTGKVVFITDGRAISYAETCLGIVEAYRLGEIVGGPTAGTNGNVIAISLPGRYKLTYTGMQVIKHDGSRHHGAGILPSVPAARTIAGIAAGKDELLEKAIEVASGRKG